jgi:hypothetical protein
MLALILVLPFLCIALYLGTYLLTRWLLKLALPETWKSQAKPKRI